jgi:hypothetical protein
MKMDVENESENEVEVEELGVLDDEEEGEDYDGRDIVEVKACVLLDPPAYALL